MRSFELLSAVVLSISLMAPMPAFSQEQARSEKQRKIEDELGIEMTQERSSRRDCHKSVRYHYVEYFGKKVWHRHRQSDCRIVLEDPPFDDDDEDLPRDCHRDVQRHFLQQYGKKVWHKHVGPNCRVKIYNPYDDDDRPHGGNCIRIGPITYCEN